MRNYWLQQGMIMKALISPDYNPMELLKNKKYTTENNV